MIFSISDVEGRMPCCLGSLLFFSKTVYLCCLLSALAHLRQSAEHCPCDQICEQDQKRQHEDFIKFIKILKFLYLSRDE